MVQLSFRVSIKADIGDVWAFFGDFGKVTQWDPNTVRIQPLEHKQQLVGSRYNLTSLFNGKESDLEYTLH